MAKANPQAPLGSGGRAAAIKQKVVAEYTKKGMSTAKAEKIAGGVIGKQGRAAHGGQQMTDWSQAGRKKKG